MGERWQRFRAARSARIAVPALALAAALGLGIALILVFVANERARDLQGWQERMSLVAESRLAAVAGWLEENFSTLQKLADNAALQLYATELIARKETATLLGDEPEFGYLRNLLDDTALRSGFAPAAEPVAANVSRLGVAGLALIDLEGRAIVASRGMALEDQFLTRALAGAHRGERHLIDLHSGADGALRIGFLVPVFALQSDAVAESQIAWLAGLRPLGGDFFALLRQPGLTMESAEVALVRGAEGTIERFSPPREGEPAVRTFSPTPESAAAFALDRPGGFALKRDARGREVLAVARAVAGTPWSLLATVTAEEALAESRTRAARLLTVLLLALALAGAALVAVWFHASSRRATETAARYRELAAALESRERLLRLITDSNPEPIFVLDSAMRIRFANRRTGESAGVAASDLLGKSLGSTLGPAAAAPFEAAAREAMASGEAVVKERRMEQADAPARVVQTRHIPLPAEDGREPEVLVLNEDITAALSERERHAHELEELIATLIGVVDRRDPFAAHHSRRVADVAAAIAEEMALPEADKKTIATAARLMNIGKILVPTELLAAERTLSEDERQRVRKSILAGADLLEGVAFEGPVVETLRQILEHWDGSGIPRGLDGEAILSPARVIAVANAFVGLVSTRAYRDGLDFNPAIDHLLKESGHKYDRAVVAALMNHLDNKGGRKRWAPFRRQPESL